MFGRRVLMSTCHRMGSFTTRQHPVIVIANKLQINAFSSAAEHAECSKGCCCGTTLCWKCGNPVSKCSFFCTHGKCNAIQTIDTADDECNYFELLEIPASFKVDLGQMEKNLKMLQRKLHPDVYATKSDIEKDASTSCSSAINQAYQILSSPMDRTAYLLSLKGVNVLTEGGDPPTVEDDKETASYMAKVMMNTFLMREQVADCSSAAEFRKLHADLSAQIQQAEEDLQRAWDGNDTAALTRAAISMKYASKAMEELMLKEESLVGNPL